MNSSTPESTVVSCETGSSCCAPPPPPSTMPPETMGAYRRALIVAMTLNAIMFFLETIGSWVSGAVSLMADAVDFGGDTLSYAMSLSVLGMALATRARVAALKGSIMLVFGVVVLARTFWGAWQGQAPEAETMGIIATVALAVNVTVATLLYRFRNGDADMRSVWLCSRNDALNNLAILVAAVVVGWTGSRWPDLAVALFMGTLAVTGGVAVLKQASKEWQR